MRDRVISAKLAKQPQTLEALLRGQREHFREMLYRLAVQHLVGDPAPPPIAMDAPPQAGEGSIGIVSPDGRTDLGRVYTYADAAKINWTENWVEAPGFFTASAFDMRQIQPPRPDPWTTLAQQDLDGTNGTPLWSTCRKGVLQYQYTVPPSDTAINALPAAPLTWSRKEFSVTTVRPGGSAVTGSLYREIRPSGSLSWTDHWRLSPAYVVPSGGDVSIGGTVTRVSELPTASSSLKSYLTAKKSMGGLYVQVSYTWQPM